MYSLGVVLWEIFARQPPMQDVPRRELMTRVCYEELRPDVSVLPLSCPAAYKKLCEACWLKPAMAEYRYVHITTIYLLYIACASSHVLSAAAAVLRYSFVRSLLIRARLAWCWPFYRYIVQAQSNGDGRNSVATKRVPGLRNTRMS